MRNNIISYNQMCHQESTSSLQRGMNYRHKGRYSVLLMSLRKNALYQDILMNDGKTLIYEGHDASKSETKTPKQVDQPEYTTNGRLTENGKFHAAAQKYLSKSSLEPELVRVYEKLKSGIWSDNGFFHLVDSYQEFQEGRFVFKFKLKAIEEEISNEFSIDPEETKRSRIIPTNIKIEVWKRDKGVCTMCGAENELHFDHIIPFSKGGTSFKVENIQLLCARHNLSKTNKIV